MISKKKRQAPEEILVQIKETDKKLYQYVEESKKVLKIRAKDNVQLKARIVKETGTMMAENRTEHNRICLDIQQIYKGYIGRGTVQYACPAEWKNPAQNKTGKNQYSIVTMSGEAKICLAEDSNDLGVESDSNKKIRLSEQEKQYVQAFESEYKTNRQIVDFMEYWTGLSHTDQGRIMLSTEEGSDWRKRIVEEGKPKMLQLAKQATKSHLGWIQETLRTLNRIENAVSDIFYEEEQLRESKKEMEGI